MRERGDFQCLHEPFLRYYYLHRTGKTLVHFDGDDGHPKTYQGVKEMILEMADKGPVFAKDMSYYVIPELLDDADFCRCIRHCFLIRDPRKSILSYYRLDPNLSCDEVGLAAQWQHYQGIEALGLEIPVVIEAEAIQSNPKSIMRLFWQSLGLDYREEAFAWNSESTPQDWQYVKGWHEQVGRSTGIKSVKPADDIEAQQEFDKAIEQAPQLKDYLDYHLPCYQALKQRSFSAGI